MSNNTIYNKNNNKVFQNTPSKMAERQSSTGTTSKDSKSAIIDSTTQQHQHFINIPLPQTQATNINILQQLNLPPLPPPAAFQAVQPGLGLAPKLNPSAPVFTPNPFINIPLSTPTSSKSSKPSQQKQSDSVQGYNQQKLLQQQQALINQKIQESLAKLQLLSIQLNTLNLINQQNQNIQSIQQYQNVYQQYQLEIANSMLLNQYLQNLNNMQIQSQLNQTTPGQLKNSQLNDDQKQKESSPVHQLETIEEGEEEEEMMEDGDNIAPAAPSTHSFCEGTDDQKNDTLDTTAIGGECDDIEAEPQSSTLQIGEGHEKVSELEKIKRQIRGILNKITPENFDKLSQEIAKILKLTDIAGQTEKFQGLSAEQIRVAQKAQFKALIKLILKCILEKAINEPLFSNQYARLCYSLYLYAEQNELKKKLFRQQLLSLCHSVFKKARKNAERLRFIGIVTMIGELFTYGLVSWKVVSSGIFEQLLPPEQPLDIEAVCKLLKTSGHNFDRRHYKEINSVIDDLAKYSQGYDFRVQCLVRDIYEMRQNDWKQRKVHKKEEPKTLNQIHTEFHAQQTKPKYNKVPGAYNTAQRQSTYRPKMNSFYNPNMNNSGGYRPKYNNHNQRGHGYQARGGYNKYNQGGYNKYNGKYNGHYNANSQSQRRKSKALRPTVEFVKDVTLPDRSHYAANTRLTKTWAMRNSGELSWGDNVELVYFKGDETLSVQKRYSVIDAQPGQEVHISADIVTPSTPGRYCTYFRLQKNGKFFGPRVWVDIIVADDGKSNGLTQHEVHNNQMIGCQ